MKIVINKSHGGFSLSEEVYHRYATYINKCPTDIKRRGILRNDPLLIEIIFEIGCERASGEFSSLKVVDIPDGTMWEIFEYDGVETIHPESPHG